MALLNESAENIAGAGGAEGFVADMSAMDAGKPEVANGDSLIGAGSLGAVAKWPAEAGKTLLAVVDVNEVVDTVLVEVVEVVAAMFEALVPVVLDAPVNVGALPESEPDADADRGVIAEGARLIADVVADRGA